jgi:ADP-ribose pyrophosphatase YjhB (NUDIX family)
MTKSRHAVIPRTMSFIFHDDEILFIKASAQKKWAGISSPVGGHIEISQDILEAAKREIMEETGLKLPNTQLVGVVHATNFYGQNIMLFVTVSHSKTKDVVQKHTEGELFWVKVNDLESVILHTDLRPILDYILKNPGHLFTATTEFDANNELISLSFDGKKIY